MNEKIKTPDEYQAEIKSFIATNPELEPLLEEYRQNVSCLVVSPEGNFLMTKSPKEQGFSFPQGGVDDNSHETAIQDELQEELGIGDDNAAQILEVVTLGDSVKQSYGPKRRLDELQRTPPRPAGGKEYSPYLVKISAGEIKPNAHIEGKVEVEQANWLTPEEVVSRIIDSPEADEKKKTLAEIFIRGVNQLVGEEGSRLTTETVSALKNHLVQAGLLDHDSARTSVRDSA